MANPASDPFAGLRDELRRFVPKRDWEWLYAPKNLSAALSVAVAELLEPFQWLTEAESAALPADVRARVGKEMANVLLYLVLLADKLDVDLAAAAWELLVANRQARGVESGRGRPNNCTES